MGDVSIDVEPDARSFASLPGATLEEKIQSAVKANNVVVFARSTCPFCIEVSRTLVELGVQFTYYRIDLFNGPDNITGPHIHAELKRITGQKTLPYVYINGSLVGGCDATKALVASGEFDRLLGDVPSAEPPVQPLSATPAAGVAATATATATIESVDLEKGLPLGATQPGAIKVPPSSVPTAGVDEGAPHVIGSLLEFPNTVDGRVIRVVALQVFALAVLLAALSYKQERSWRWVAVGLLTDFCLRFYAGAGISPLGSVAMLVLALYDLVAGRLLGRATGPVWGAGPPKQFAVAVGIFFSAAIVVFQFTQVWQAATVFAVVLAFFAALEGVVNFCAGCWVFGHAIRLRLVPDTVYMIHINTLPETKYAWEELTKVVHPTRPVAQRLGFAGRAKPTRVDLRYKTGKSDDVEREDFAYVRHSKVACFSSVVGVAAVPALFKFMSLSPRFVTPPLVWQVLTLLSLVYTAAFTLPYLLKMACHPHKVRSEWMHPAMNNAFSIPSMTLAVYAFLAAGSYSTALARVLFWAGASTGTLLAVVTVGNWVATLRHEGHVNGAWMMSPVGLYIFAVVGPIIEPSYTQVCFLFFGFATVMYVMLQTIVFQRFTLGHNSDPRMRMFAAIWIAAPAVASIAWTVLTSGGASFAMDPIAQSLFYVAVAMALICAWMAWRRFLWSDRFFMQQWAFGFPTAALAWAGVLYDATVQTALSKVLASALVALACIAGSVLTLRTLAGVARLKVFIPEHKWGPMSHLPLAQESMRAMLLRLVATADALADAPGNARLRATLAAQWRAFATVNAFYGRLKRDICFPQIGAFFPGHQADALARNAAMLEAQHRLEGAIAAGASGPHLKEQVRAFSAQVRATFDHMEDHIKPVVRRYIPLPIQRKIMNDCWDAGPAEGWFAVLPAVVQALPMHAQRVTYVRAFLWAMPERCQQIGVMVALGVDPVTWYRLRRGVPEIIPRGEAGWKRF